eukprot:10826951-Alexandrium_andersonii.AAC.1
MAQSSNGWHEDVACATVVAPIATWTNDEIDSFIRDIHEYGRPLRPRIAHTACTLQHYPYDICSMRATGPPDQFLHSL